jgi:hypothetical protein
MKTTLFALSDEILPGGKTASQFCPKVAESMLECKAGEHQTRKLGHFCIEVTHWTLSQLGQFNII